MQNASVVRGEKNLCKMQWGIAITEPYFGVLVVEHYFGVLVVEPYFGVLVDEPYFGVIVWAIGPNHHTHHLTWGNTH